MLDRKKWAKNDHSTLKLNEIHVVDSPCNEDPKNRIFFHGGPNFGGGAAGEFRENGQ